MLEIRRRRREECFECHTALFIHLLELVKVLRYQTAPESKINAGARFDKFDLVLHSLCRRSRRRIIERHVDHSCYSANSSLRTMLVILSPCPARLIEVCMRINDSGKGISPARINFTLSFSRSSFQKRGNLPILNCQIFFTFSIRSNQYCISNE